MSLQRVTRAAVSAALLGLSVALLVLSDSQTAPAEESFASKLGQVKVGDLKTGDVIDVPFFTWGGDVATFMANGGAKETKPGTLFAEQGLKLNLVPGDDFVGQCKNYLEGKTPFLRGTMSQLGQASEVLGKDPRTQPVVFLQLTWSLGDHLVGRANIKNLNELKGKKVALQWGGPHVGMLDDVLRSASLKWSDITVVWTEDVSGDKGPAEKFRKDASVDACFVITPEMVDLTGGLEKTGDGADKTVKGAHVVVSTRSLTHSIADVYAVRKDYYDKNKATVEKFVAGYLKATEDLTDLVKAYLDKKDKAQVDKYKAVLKMTQDIYGKEVIPDLDAAHGLILDANFVALPGNYRFFKDPKDPVNFQNRRKAALDMAVDQGYVKERIEFAAADLDYKKIKELGKLKLDIVKERPAEDPKVTDLDKERDTLYSFTIYFDADDMNFDVSKYAKDFQKVIDEQALFGNAVFVVRGHADPTRTLRQFVQGGLEKRIITREKVGDVTKYYSKDGKEFQLSDTRRVIELIKASDFGDLDENPKTTLEAAQKLSEQRAAKVREATIAFAKERNVPLAAGRLKSEGVGIAEPVIMVPKNPEEAAKNRRVEFRVLGKRVSPEKTTAEDYQIDK